MKTTRMTGTLLCAVGLLTATAFGRPSGYNKLVFSEEFEGSGIDESKWNIRSYDSYWGNRLNPGRVKVENGILVISNVGGEGGWIDTEDKFPMHYGYVEARCRLSSTQNQEYVWPCFWLKEGFPPGAWKPEYDIAEYYSKDGDRRSDVTQASHFDAPGGGRCDDHHQTGHPRAEWGVFGVLIEPGENPVYYLNGSPGYTTKCGDPDEETIIILHALTSGGSAPWPDFLVDYVRVYEQGEADTVAPAISTQPSDVVTAVGRSATFQVSATGYPLAYQWLRDGQQIDGATSSSYTLDDVVMADEGSVFAVRVYNDEGSVTSESASLTVMAWDGIMLATDFPYEESCYEFNGSMDALEVPVGGTEESCEVSELFPGSDGVYRVTLNVIAENDGQSQYKVLVNGTQVGETITAPLSSGQTAVELAEEVTIAKGDEITVWSQNVEAAWGRWTSIEFVKQNTSVTVGKRAVTGATGRLLVRTAGGKTQWVRSPLGAYRSVAVMDAQGRKVTASGSAQTAVGPLAPGLYVVVFSGDRRTAIRKLSIVR